MLGLEHAGGGRSQVAAPGERQLCGLRIAGAVGQRRDLVSSHQAAKAAGGIRVITVGIDDTDVLGARERINWPGR